MPQRRTPGLQLLVVLAAAFVGLGLIGLHASWLSLHYAHQKSVLGGFMRELVWLDLPFAAAVLGLLSVKSRTFVAPLVGMAIGMLAGLLATTMLLPEARFVLWPATNVVPGPAMQLFPRALPTPVVALACIFAFFATITGLANAQAWLERKQERVWLSFVLAAGYALFLTVVASYARGVLPPQEEMRVLFTLAAAVVLLGFFAAALFGAFFAVWAGTFVGHVGQVILVWVLVGPGQFGPVILVLAAVGAGFAFPGAFVGQRLRGLVLGRRPRPDFT